MMTSKKPKEQTQPIQPTSVQPPQNLPEETNDTTQTKTPPEVSEKAQPSEQPATRTKVRYFKNTNITGLSFVSKDGRMHTFIDGVFRTDDPVVIEGLKGTQDYQYGFIKEFDPSKINDEA